MGGGVGVHAEARSAKEAYSCEARTRGVETRERFAKILRMPGCKLVLAILLGLLIGCCLAVLALFIPGLLWGGHQ
jgi:hypothetical protein